jgi:hypothetical protein
LDSLLIARSCPPWRDDPASLEVCEGAGV